MAFTQDQISRLNNLQTYKGYYTVHSKGLFEGESIVCRKILDYIESQKDFNEQGIFKIAEIYNEISSYDHLNGSGWFDFQIRLGGFYGVWDTMLILILNRANCILKSPAPKKSPE